MSCPSEVAASTCCRGRVRPWRTSERPGRRAPRAAAAAEPRWCTVRAGLLTAESPLTLRPVLVQLLPSPATGEAPESRRTEVSLCSSYWWAARSAAVSCRPTRAVGRAWLAAGDADWGVRPRAPRARDRRCPGKGPAHRAVPLVAADGYTVRMARPSAHSHTRPRAHDGPGSARTGVSGLAGRPPSATTGSPGFRLEIRAVATPTTHMRHRRTS